MSDLYFDGPFNINVVVDCEAWQRRRPIGSMERERGRVRGFEIWINRDQAGVYSCDLIGEWTGTGPVPGEYTSVGLSR